MFPIPPDGYPAPLAGAPLLEVLGSRVRFEPFNLVASGIFLLAILHTFLAPTLSALAKRLERRQVEAFRRRGDEHPHPSFGVEMLDLVGEVEVVFGVWAVVLVLVMSAWFDWGTAKHYINDQVNYTEPLFVVVIMALAATAPVVLFAERLLLSVASIGGGTPAAWWLTILTIGPLLGSFITEPGAMTISALLLGRHFFSLSPPRVLAYATLGVLFVNVSIGGVLTHFAVPPVLMVARHWGWSMGFMSTHFGWRAVIAVLVSNTILYVLFRRQFERLRHEESASEAEAATHGAPDSRYVPGWVIAVNLLFIAWTVMNAHYPALFLGGFLFFLGFARATAPYQHGTDLRAPLLVGFFLAGLVIHGGLQGWWIAPLLERLGDVPLFLGAATLTAFNDNALITYLSTLVPHLSPLAKYAVVAGAVTGGGLTVIANAPNPAGQALLGRYFGEGGIRPLELFLGALGPTLIAGLCFMAL